MGLCCTTNDTHIEVETMGRLQPDSIRIDNIGAKLTSEQMKSVIKFQARARGALTRSKFKDPKK